MIFNIFDLLFRFFKNLIKKSNILKISPSPLRFLFHSLKLKLNLSCDRLVLVAKLSRKNSSNFRNIVRHCVLYLLLYDSYYTSDNSWKILPGVCCDARRNRNTESSLIGAAARRAGGVCRRRRRRRRRQFPRYVHFRVPASRGPTRHIAVHVDSAHVSGTLYSE